MAWICGAERTLRPARDLRDQALAENKNMVAKIAGEAGVELSYHFRSP